MQLLPNILQLILTMNIDTFRGSCICKTIFTNIIYIFYCHIIKCFISLQHPRTHPNVPQWGCMKLFLIETGHPLKVLHLHCSLNIVMEPVR